MKIKEHKRLNKELDMCIEELANFYQNIDMNKGHVGRFEDGDVERSIFIFDECHGNYNLRFLDGYFHGFRKEIISSNFDIVDLINEKLENRYLFAYNGLFLGEYITDDWSEFPVNAIEYLQGINDHGLNQEQILDIENWKKEWEINSIDDLEFFGDSYKIFFTPNFSSFNGSYFLECYKK